MTNEKRDSTCWGVSVVVCSHNGAGRLPSTLAHLAAQSVPQDLPWEVIVIDNASADDTSEVARHQGIRPASASFRIISEPRLGLSHARCRGLEESRYEVVSFVDDDNWVCRNWVQQVATIMATNPEIGACGGSAAPECEISPPSWFERVQSCYAVGAQSDRAGDVTWTKGYVWGAGLTVRKSAWRQLQRLGFRFLLTDRKGSELQSGGDMELCYALRLAGWTLWYDPRLEMRHYIPASRLTWSYVRKMHRGFGVAAIGLKTYYPASNRSDGGYQSSLRGRWWCQAGLCLVRIMGQIGRLAVVPRRLQGHPAVLELESLAGSLAELVRHRSSYDRMFRNTQSLFSSSVAHRVTKAA